MNADERFQLELDELRHDVDTLTVTVFGDTLNEGMQRIVGKQDDALRLIAAELAAVRADFDVFRRDTAEAVSRLMYIHRDVRAFIVGTGIFGLILVAVSVIVYYILLHELFAILR